MGESLILAQSWSDVCDIQAFVEQTDQCTYFYLWVHPGGENSSVHACWVCNNAPAPQELDVDAMKEGQAPMMPADNVLHDLEGICLTADQLEIVWFEEGDAAALLEGGKLVCVIPSWAGVNGFPGYSRYAKEENVLAWGLQSAEETLAARVERSRRFWEYFEQENYWEAAQASYMDALQAFFGDYEKYYAIDGGEFPPKAYITGEKDHVCYGFTAGVSLMCMPQVEMYYEEPADYRRVEFGFAAAEIHKPLLQKMGSFLSALAKFPWQEQSFFGHGHTIRCGSLKGFSAVWFLNANVLPQLSSPVYPRIMGERVNLLWAVPVTAEEYQWLQEHSVEDALQKCRDIRTVAVFDGNPKLAL